jgi:hypothetical protein
VQGPGPLVSQVSWSVGEPGVLSNNAYLFRRAMLREMCKEGKWRYE